MEVDVLKKYLPIMVCGIVILLAIIAVLLCTLPSGNTAGDAIDVELSEVDHILVSTEVFYLDDWNNAMWATVTHPDKVEAVFNAISKQKLKPGYPDDESLSGACPRFVTYVLKDGTEVEIRFMDDQQFWLDSETVFWFKTPFRLYDEIDEILKEYVYLLKTEESSENDPESSSAPTVPAISSRNTSLKIFSELSGQETTVTDAEIIDTIAENLNTLEFEPHPITEEAPGYAYNLTFYNNLTLETANIMILDQNGTMILVNGNRYITKGTDRINVTYIADLVENKE